MIYRWIAERRFKSRTVTRRGFERNVRYARQKQLLNLSAVTAAGGGSGMKRALLLVLILTLTDSMPPVRLSKPHEA